MFDPIDTPHRIRALTYDGIKAVERNVYYRTHRTRLNAAVDSYGTLNYYTMEHEGQSRNCLNTYQNSKLITYF